MFALNVITLYTTLFNLNHVESTHHNSFCATGSYISAWVDGKYEFYDTNSVGTIYYNNQTNLYLFPWNQSAIYKQYLIGENASTHTAHSFSTIQRPSPYTFIEEDFSSNWQSYAQINGSTQLVNDTNMRLINCNSVCIHSITYEWVKYNISTETSIYYSKSTNAYLYRSNINQNTEKWQRDIGNGTLFSQFSGEISMQPCAGIIISDDTNLTTNITVTVADKDLPVIKTENNNYDLLIVLVVGSIAFIVIIIAIIIIIRKCIFHSNTTKTHKQSDTTPETNSKWDRKLSVPTTTMTTMATNNSNITTMSHIKEERETNLKLELDDIMRKRTISTYNEYGFSSDDDVFDVRKRTMSASARSVRSSSKYADILPPSKPPPIGLKPILTAKQQSSRPLPPTPTSTQFSDI